MIALPTGPPLTVSRLEIESATAVEFPSHQKFFRWKSSSTEWSDSCGCCDCLIVGSMPYRWDERASKMRILHHDAMLHDQYLHGNSEGNGSEVD